MKVIVVFKRLLASGNYTGNYTNMAAIYSNGGNRWNSLGFNFTKRDTTQYITFLVNKLPDSSIAKLAKIK